MENLRDVAFKRRAKGTGTVYKLSGTRSKPWVAAITTGRNKETGKQIQTPQGYFSSREEAIDCLMLYLLKDRKLLPDEIIGIPALESKYIQFIYSMIDQKILPNDVRDIKDISLVNGMFMVKVAQEGVNIKTEKLAVMDVPTVEEIWERLLESDLKHLTDRSLTNYTVSFNHLKSLHNRKISTIAYNDLQPIFDSLMQQGTGQSKMNNIKIVLSYIFKYALKYDYVEKNYAEFIKFSETLSEDAKKKKTAFDKQSIEALYKRADNDLIASSILVMCWTGMRPSELLGITKENVHLEERYMIGGIKTKSGINRIIPIHDCIAPYIATMLNNKSSYLFSWKDTQVPYWEYLMRYNSLIATTSINDKYTPHCGRHTFATICNECELSEYLVKVIIGHTTKDLTKDVYTHASTERLIKEVNKLPSIEGYIKK